MSRPGWFATGRGGARSPPNQAQRRAPQNAQNPRDGYAYGVHIIKHGNGVMGLQLDGSLFIRQVNDGLVKEWNQANRHAEVLVGDQIVFVNGIQGDVEAMFAAIKSHRELRMTLHRYTTSGQYQASSQAPQQLTEEEQIQWAIRRSMEEATAASSASAAKEPSADGQGPQTTAASGAASEGQELGKAVIKEGFMEATEVQKLLEAAEARQAQVAAERSDLRQQVAENESIIKGLTEQLDAVNRQLTEKTAKCEALEAALKKGKDSGIASAGGADLQQLVGEEEQQGVVSQLLVRIQELEATLQQATHFAPVETAAEGGVAELALAGAAPPEATAAVAAEGEGTPSEPAPAGADEAETQEAAPVEEGTEATSAAAPEPTPDDTGGKNEAAEVLDLTGDTGTAAAADVPATEVAA
mmetsp:Transcript_11187/g.20359  ORF Transcript_11187/g.20359 Transcript_11187/m.20359 type:complete len:413 (-) Transcript_11187:222-1460(-)